MTNQIMNSNDRGRLGRICCISFTQWVEYFNPHSCWPHIISFALPYGVENKPAEWWTQMKPLQRYTMHNIPQSLSDLPKSYSEDAMIPSGGEKIKLQTLPLVLGTSQNGGSKPSCYSEQWTKYCGCCTHTRTVTNTWWKTQKESFEFQGSSLIASKCQNASNTKHKRRRHDPIDIHRSAWVWRTAEAFKVVNSAWLATSTALLCACCVRWWQPGKKDSRRRIIVHNGTRCSSGWWAWSNMPIRHTYPHVPTDKLPIHSLLQYVIIYKLPIHLHILCAISTGTSEVDYSVIKNKK